jgi:hypothetical protein
MSRKWNLTSEHSKLLICQIIIKVCLGGSYEFVMTYLYSYIVSSGIGDCNEICYKDPVIKDHPWSAYIDRSPGQDDNSVVYYLSTIYFFQAYS